MRLQVVGIEQVNYTSKEGRDVSGTSIHGIEVGGRMNPDLNGSRVEKLWVSSNSRVALPQMSPNDIIHVEYNRRGWVDCIEVEPKK